MKEQNRISKFSKTHTTIDANMKKADLILKTHSANNSFSINDILDLYDINKKLEYEFDLSNLTIDIVDQIINPSNESVANFMSKIHNDNIITHFEFTLKSNKKTFWKLFDNYKVYKRISSKSFMLILASNPNQIRSILKYKKITAKYNVELRDFLLANTHSAELILSIYEQKSFFGKQQLYLPKALTMDNKENIISDYLNRENANLNYIKLIKNSKKSPNFTISDKIRLKATRKEKEVIEKIFSKKDASSFKRTVSVTFKKSITQILEINFDGNDINYIYNIDYIKNNTNIYTLYRNFDILFQYTDEQNRVALISKKSQLGIFEKYLSVQSNNEYITGAAFRVNNISSINQIYAYNKILFDLGKSLEGILNTVFTSVFVEKYKFANNARIEISQTSLSYLEKLRLLAPEFESVLKQYKLFVEEGEVDFELLQVSSSPCSLKDIPSLVSNKYIYINEKNEEVQGYLNLLFSDQTSLVYIKPFEEKEYASFYDLLVNEEFIKVTNYENSERIKVEYLIEKELIVIDGNGFIKIKNHELVEILKDLYDNEFAAFHHYTPNFQTEVHRMVKKGFIIFEDSLLSKPEQSYFNYFLNKSEFTNGLDLRNSYLHGTQASPCELNKHKYAYFAYLRLLVLLLRKIEDDLFISQQI